MIVGSCPDCGCVAELAAFVAGPLAKEQLVAALKLGKEVQAELVGYLGLFRPGPGKRALTDPKAARILRELAELVGAGSVQWKRGAARPSAPRLWAQGMRRMVELRDTLALPMESHGYLTSIVYDLADKADAAREKAAREAEAGGHRPPPAAAEPADSEDLGPAAERARREFSELTAALAGRAAMPRPAAAKKTVRPAEVATNPCGECPACQAGVPSRCTDRRVP